MGKKHKIIAWGIGAISVGIMSWIVVAGITGNAVASRMMAVAFKSQPTVTSWESWSTVDDFRKGLPALLSGSDSSPERFNVEALARKLYTLRVNGFPICSADEVSAQQYIYLSDIAHKLERFDHATAQLNALLDKPNGITDCQFRILDGATTIPGVTKK